MFNVISCPKDLLVCEDLQSNSISEVLLWLHRARLSSFTCLVVENFSWSVNNSRKFNIQQGNAKELDVKNKLQKTGLSSIQARLVVPAWPVYQEFEKTLSYLHKINNWEMFTYQEVAERGKFWNTNTCNVEARKCWNRKRWSASERKCEQYFQWLNTQLRRSINVYIMYASCINTQSSLSVLCVKTQPKCVVIVNLVAH